MSEQSRIGEVEVSVAGLGCNNFGRRIDEERTRQVVQAALESGVTCFDTADTYGDGRSEEFLGRALGARRDEVVIVTKFGGGNPAAGAAPDRVPLACDASLRRLGTDRIDVYLLHVPHAATPIGDTLGALNELVHAGKVREIGCSNFTAEQLDEAAAAAAGGSLRPFVTVQNEYSLLHRDPEEGVLQACERLGMSFMPYFPLGSGVLSGKYRRGEPVPGGTRLGGDGGKLAEDVIAEDRLDVAERLRAFAESRGHTLLELAMSWVAAQPGVPTVIAGATSPEQVRANSAALAAWSLADDELHAIDELTRAES